MHDVGRRRARATAKTRASTSVDECGGRRKRATRDGDGDGDGDGANIDWVRAVFFFAGLGIGSRAFGERGVRGRAKTRARDEGGRRGGEPL